MAIVRKPTATPAATRSEREIEALINKGGSVAEPPQDKGKGIVKTTSVILRLPAETLEWVDRAVESRAPRIPRHTWLLEAVLEKLERGIS